MMTVRAVQIVTACYNDAHSSLECYFFSLSVVTVTISQQFYTVGEGDGEVEVCVILRGQTERDVTVTVSTMSGTASGIDILLTVRGSVTSKFSCNFRW